MIIGVCTIELYLPGVSSLKQKRSVIKPLLTRLHNTFNISAAEVEHQDVWQTAVIGVAVVTNSTPHAQQVLNNVVRWIETSFPQAYIVRQEVEIL
jgi:uncharacterized protein YlxP (DUF503 family)